jgi:hypothetical protein
MVFVLIKLKKAAMTSLAVLILLSLPVTLSAGSAGTSEDPLVTYSYINGTFKSDLKAQLKAEIIAELGGGVNSGETASSSYTVEKLTMGQSLRAKDACEIILRSGGATVFVESEENILAGVGLSDCTDGAEIRNGTAVPQKHLLIISRGDGRGVTVNTAEAYIMVRGAYEIIKVTG